MTLKMAVFAPIPMASVATTRRVNIGARTSRLRRGVRLIAPRYADPAGKVSDFAGDISYARGALSDLFGGAATSHAARTVPMRLTCRERSVPGLLTGAVVLLGFWGSLHAFQGMASPNR